MSAPPRRWRRLSRPAAPAARRAWVARLLPRPRGRVLAVKWGMNPNSSSLGVDVTFLLFGMMAVALLTPLVSLLLRARGLLGGRPPRAPSPPAPPLGPLPPTAGGEAG